MTGRGPGSAGSLDRIELRLALRITALLAGMMVLILVAGTAMYARIEARQRDQLVGLVGEMLAESMQGVNAAGKYRTRWTIERLVRDNPTLLSITVVDAEGHITAASDKHLDDTTADADRQALTRAVIASGTPRTVTRRVGDDQVTEVIHPLQGGYGDAIIGAVHCGVKTSSLQETLLAGALPIGALLALLMGLSLPAVQALSRRFGAPTRRLAAAVEQAADLVALIDLDDRVVYTNPAFSTLTGIDAVAARRADPWRMLGATSDQRAEQRAALAAGRSWRGRVTMARADGTSFPCSQVVSPVLSPAGEPVSVVVLGRDISQEEALQAQLRQAQKMEVMGRLAGGVAHDFNNLLTVLIGRSEMLLDDAPPGSTLARELQVIVDTSSKAAELTAQLLAVSRRQVQRTELLDLGDVVDEVMPMLTRLLGEDVSVEHVRGDALWTVAADRSQVEQIVLNLAVNARDAMPDGGRLVIETHNRAGADDLDRHGAPPEERAGDYVVIAVSDTGEGIPADVRDHIFEPFFTTKGVGKGTGLGLAMVAGIVDQSGGRIGVYSEAGVGTTFRIHLPRRDDLDEASLPGSTDAASPPPVGGDELILVVEDNDGVRDTISRMLRAAGYQTLLAPDAAAALELLRRTVPDLVLSDLVMPGIQGDELVRRLRSAHPGLPVVLMSGYSERLVSDPQELEGLELVEKPPTRSALLGAVRRTLDAAVQDVAEGSTV